MATPKDKKSILLDELGKIPVPYSTEKKKKSDEVTTLPANVRKQTLRDLKKTMKNIYIPELWKDGISQKLSSTSKSLSEYIIEALKEKMERDGIETYI